MRSGHPLYLWKTLNPFGIKEFAKNISTAILSKLPWRYGRSAGTRTLGLLLPKQARYQLRNTPIFNKTPLYYSIMGRFRKAFLVMVKIVGWLQKRVNFRKTETRKPLCRKALRRFQKMGLTKSYYVPNQARYQLRYTRILLILE